MAYTHGNKCAKTFFKRTVLLQFIIENVVFFLEYSVLVLYNVCVNSSHAMLQKTGYIHLNKLTIANFSSEVVHISSLALLRITFGGTLHVTRFAACCTLYTKRTYIIHCRSQSQRIR